MLTTVPANIMGGPVVVMSPRPAPTPGVARPRSLRLRRVPAARHPFRSIPRRCIAGLKSIS
ncbi:hypothetical protein PJP10_10485 [Mycobacterium kansasii]